MRTRHVISDFQAWIEDQIDDAGRREIQLHLDHCDDCRSYFDRLKRLMEGLDPASLPHLEPDPFLPARIRAIASGDPTAATEDKGGSDIPVRPALGRLGKSALVAAVSVAAVIGVVFGSGLSSRVTASAQTQDAAIATAYLEAFSPSDVSSDWEYVVEAEDEEEDDS
jgi:anti-sigma factor RsiW